MALINTTFRPFTHIRKLERLVDSSLSRRLRSQERAPRDSCALRPRPACTPCEPRPPPACRRPAHACPRALRVVCCPPPANQRPPCSPTLATCPLTCDNTALAAKTVENFQAQPCKRSDVNKCGSEQLDHVARRLALAERARRADYEREASEPAPAPRPPPASYCLAAERQCLRATDGQDYMCSKSNAECEKPVCGPDRTPPPPRPIKLMSSEGCEIKSRGHLDPCAHRPRIIVEVDHSEAKNSNNVNKPKGSIATRLMDSFSFKKNVNSSCPRQKCEDPQNWCKSPPQLAPTPPRCRERTLAERLQERSKRIQNNAQRKLHSCSASTSGRVTRLSSLTSSSTDPATTVTGTKSEIDKLSSVLEEKKKLNEAGQGRVVGGKYNKNKSEAPTTGSIELRVPSDTEAVKVRVTLDFDHNLEKQFIEKAKTEMSAHCMKSDENKSQSWLSIKNIQKKLAGCTKKSDSNRSNQKKVCPSKPQACPIPANPCVGPKPVDKNKPDSRNPPPRSGTSPCTPRDPRSRFTADTDGAKYNIIFL